MSGSDGDSGIAGPRGNPRVGRIAFSDQADVEIPTRGKLVATDRRGRGWSGRRGRPLARDQGVLRCQQQVAVSQEIALVSQQERTVGAARGKSRAGG